MAITRFAPSPTGYLHIGGLRTALYNYLWAKKTNGQFKLRIEDTDNARNSQEAVDAIVEAFEWVGMKSQSQIEYQSKRADIYNQYIQRLLDEGKAYKCYMSKEDLAKLRAKQEANKQTPRYDGTWRPQKGKTLPKIPQDITPVIRLDVAKSNKDISSFSFVDGIKGDMSFGLDQVDDFIIARSNGGVTYNFAVVIDDFTMGMTDILRGDDHLSNTPKQIAIYNALGFKIPKFYHIPMINNTQGKKLSKRDGAMSVMEYKNLGYLPQALLNFLVRLGWSYGDQEIFSMHEMQSLFDPSNINKSASTYNQEKLLWLNAHYIKNSPNKQLLKELEYFDCVIIGHDKKEMVLDICKERANTLVELKEAIENILVSPKDYQAKGVKKFIKQDTIPMLKEYIQILKNTKTPLHLACDFEAITKPFIHKHSLKFPQIFQPIRIALTGGTQAPAVYDILAILGLDQSIKRLEIAIGKEFR